MWLSIILSGRNTLHIFAAVIVTSQQYCTEVLLGHACIFSGTVSSDFLIIDENAHPHKTDNISDKTVGKESETMTWSAYFSDFNHIENIWDAMGKCVAQRQKPSSNHNRNLK